MKRHCLLELSPVAESYANIYLFLMLLCSPYFFPMNLVFLPEQIGMSTDVFQCQYFLILLFLDVKRGFCR